MKKEKKMKKDERGSPKGLAARRQEKGGDWREEPSILGDRAKTRQDDKGKTLAGKTDYAGTGG